MLYYDRIDISEGIDPTKSNRSKELIYYKILFLKIVVICKKYCLNFQSTRGSFFLLFCLAIYKMIDW